MLGGMGTTPPVAYGIARQGESQSRRSVAALYLGAQGHDPLPGVPRARLADRQRPDRIAMQTMHETAQRLWPPLGPAQRHRRRGPRFAGQKRSMAPSLAKRPLRHDLRPPRTLVTPLLGWRLRFLAVVVKLIPV